MDTYIHHSACVQRLLKEWEKHGRLIIAVDYDGTLAPFHDNTLHDEVIGLVKQCSDLGHLIVLYTASNPTRYPEMRAFCEARGIKVASINTNPIELPFGNWGKIYYNVLLDDRAGLFSAYVALNEVIHHPNRPQKVLTPLG